MSKKSLNDKQKKTLRRLHTAEIILEVSFVVLLLTLITANVGAAYTIISIGLVLIMLTASLTLFGSGIYITAIVISMRRLGKPLTMKWYKIIVFWLSATWVCAIASIVSFVVGASSTANEDIAATIIISIILLAFAILSGIALIICTHLLWRQFNNRSNNRLIFYGGLTAVLIILALAGKYTITEEVAYDSTFITDANLELDQREVRQSGKNGKKTITHSILFGIKLSEDIDEPVDEQIAKGSKRFQYMYCSDGSYYYYTAEQFKDPNIGYTHQSPDQCIKNGKGAQTALADTPPPEKIVQQVPVYRSPIYSSPTYTTCTESYFGNSFSCTSY